MPVGSDAMIAPQTGACLRRGRSGARGRWVHFRANRFGALAALAMAVALSGCSSIDFDAGQWFAKPLDLFGRAGGYTFSELRETRQQRPITPNDLVQENGACPASPAAQTQTASNNAAVPNGAGGTPAVQSDADPLLGGGVALGMTECDVVRRAGQPAAVQLGRNPNGDRTAVLTFQSGPRPGIYRFEAGRLMELDSTEAPPAPAKTAKKKPTNQKAGQQQ